MKTKLSFLSAILLALSFSVARAQNTLTIQADSGKYQISRFIYSHFSEHLGHCIYGGIWVGENSKIPNTKGIRNDVVKALKDIKIPALRWPGGCFADEYHWKDGIGSKEKRPTMINTTWGGVTEDNSFGTHEFMELCSQLNCEPIFCGNVGSGTVQEMSQWVEYLNSDNVSPMTDLRKQNGREKSWGVKFWGIGNETWGCGGNMTPEYYADVMRRYSTYLKNYGDNRLYKIASGANVNDFHWTETLMKDEKNRWMFDAISLHYYTISSNNWDHKGSATNFTKDEWFNTMKNTLWIDELVSKHSAIIDKYDPQKSKGLIVDEWGNWFDVEPGTNPGFLYQKNTLRDALVAGSNLNIFNNHCDRVKMANLAQVINVLQSVILTKGDSMILTPTYYVFKMYAVHQNATLLPIELNTEKYTNGTESIPEINVSASKDSTGVIHISLVNLNPDKAADISINLAGLKKTAKISGEIITAKEMNALNYFGKPEQINIKPYTQGQLKDNAIAASLPAKSVVMLTIK